MKASSTMEMDRLKAIAERAEHCAGMAEDRQVSGYLQELLTEDVPDLVAEVRRLREELRFHRDRDTPPPGWRWALTPV